MVSTWRLSFCRINNGIKQLSVDTHTPELNDAQSNRYYSVLRILHLYQEGNIGGRTPSVLRAGKQSRHIPLLLHLDGRIATESQLLYIESTTMSVGCLTSSPKDSDVIKRNISQYILSCRRARGHISMVYFMLHITVYKTHKMTTESRNFPVLIADIRLFYSTLNLFHHQNIITT